MYIIIIPDDYIVGRKKSWPDVFNKGPDRAYICNLRPLSRFTLHVLFTSLSLSSVCTPTSKAEHLNLNLDLTVTMKRGSRVLLNVVLLYFSHGEIGSVALLSMNLINVLDVLITCYYNVVTD